MGIRGAEIEGHGVFPFQLRRQGAAFLARDGQWEFLGAPPPSGYAERQPRARLGQGEQAAPHAVGDGLADGAPRAVHDGGVPGGARPLPAADEEGDAGG